jgi:hypothetical protein
MLGADVMDGMGVPGIGQGAQSIPAHVRFDARRRRRRIEVPCVALKLEPSAADLFVHKHFGG